MTAQPARDRTPLDWALAYASIGLRVVPIKPGHKRPSLAAWQDAATTDPDTIRNWWQGLYRGHGVGIALGPQPDGRNLFAVDADGPDGIAAWDALCATHSHTPNTWHAFTGGGGAHLVYAAPVSVDIRNQQAAGNRIAEHVDVRGAGGQILVAPTVHPGTGLNYEWSADPWGTTIADAPGWLLELVRPAESTPVATPAPDRIDYSAAPAHDEQSPADWLRAQWDWTAKLERAGWVASRHRGNDVYWTRPGKAPKDGHSAILHLPDGPFVVFTTEIPADLARLGTPTRDGSGRTYSPLEWVAAHEHHGSVSDASRAIRSDMVASQTNPPSAASAATEEGDIQMPGDPPPDSILIDWATFWSADRDEADWLAEPIIAAKRGTAIFAPGGTGKSLLALYISAAAATGQPLFGQPPAEPVSVLYIDFEMTESDLAERLESMGYGPDSDLSTLHYALLPSIPPLDTPEGGKAVVALADAVDADLVVIDTLGRAVEGDENEADTIRKLYRHTGLLLKQDGRAYLRVDHAGKDLTKGQRGTSAKNDDVDVVWQMIARDRGGFDLTAKKRRMSWVPEHVKITLDETAVLRFELTDGITWPAGTAEVADQLDSLDVDPDSSSRAQETAFRDAGGKARSVVIRAAIKYRRHRRNPVDNYTPGVGTHPGTHPGEPGSGRVRDALADSDANHQVDTEKSASGTRWDAVGRGAWDALRPPKGDAVSRTPSEHADSDDEWMPF